MTSRTFTALTRIVVTLVLFFYGYAVSVAQQARQYTFSHFTTADGLAANFTNSIVQDNEGYMWIATINGLQRYDGSSFLTIKTHPDKKGAIPTNNISLLYRDRKDRIWLAAVNNAVGLFDTKKLLFANVPVVSRKSYSGYTGKYFFEDFNGNLLLHDFGNLYKYDELTKAFQPANSLIPTPRNWKVTRFYLDVYEKKYWICADSGIAVYNPATQHLNYRGHNPDKEQVIEKAQTSSVYHLLPLKDQILYCTWPASSVAPLLFKINRKTGERNSMF
ncbi:MAG: hypothetical protein EOO07_38130 [Chitinophagaceae bacterium]|nr:MAG: hypothetical protein EOO07_38130 [Chitinophagaceae bacterium]